MIAFSIIQKSQLEGANRLDAEYYQQEYFIDFKPAQDSFNSCVIIEKLKEKENIL